MSGFAKVFETIFIDFIVGLQAAVWVAMLLIAGGGQDTAILARDQLAKLDDAGAIIPLAIIYSFGVVVVRLVDGLTSQVMTRSWPKLPPSLGQPGFQLLQASRARYEIFLKEEKASEYLSYLRANIRICSATVLNSLFVLISASLVLKFRTPTDASLSAQSMWMVISVASILGATAITATVIAIRAYRQRVELFGQLLRETGKGG